MWIENRIPESTNCGVSIDHIQINIAEITGFYQETELYKNIQEEYADNETNIIEIKKRYYRTDMNIETEEDMIQYMNIMEYWMAPSIPDFVYEAIMKNREKDLKSIWKGTLFEEEIEKITNMKGYEIHKLAGTVSLPFLKYLHQQEYIISKEAVNQSILADKMDCFLYLMENQFQYNPYFCCMTAIRKGRIQYLKYLLEHGCPIMEECVHESIEYGVDYLKLFHEKGFTFDKQICLIASRKGNVECLRYAVEHGCPYDANECLRRWTIGCFDKLQKNKETGKYCPPERYTECIRYIRQLF